MSRWYVRDGDHRSRLATVGTHARRTEAGFGGPLRCQANRHRASVSTPTKGPRRPVTIIPLVVLLAATLSFALPRAEAYRPFISTDAAVADPKELEIELGHFTPRRERQENTILIPSAVLKYGLWRTRDTVG